MGFWFEPTTPMTLGICRLVIFSVFLARYLVMPLNVSGYQAMSHSFWMPLPLLSAIQVPLLPGEWLRTLEWVWLAALGLSGIGLLTRLSTTLAFLLGTYLLWLPHNFGKLHHMDAIMVLVMGIMALSHCGDGWSVDRLIERARRRISPPSTFPGLSGEYRWPIRAVWLAMALVFFAAGVSKLRNSGLEWAFSDNLALMLIKANALAYTGVAPPLPWGLYLGQQAWLCQLLAAATLIGELAYPLALLSRRARWILVPGIFLIQIGIFLLFVPAFVELIACHVFWVPWDRVQPWLTDRLWTRRTTSTL